MHADVQTAINTVIAGIGYDVAWPNVEANFSNTHLRVNYLFAQSEVLSLGCDRIPGLVQVDVYVRDGQGTIIAADVVDDVVIAFPRGTYLTSGSTTVHIDRTPYAAPSLTENGWYQIPVNIPFEVYQ